MGIRQTTQHDGFEPDQDRRGVGTDEPEPQRIQDMIIVLRNAPENLSDIGDGLQILDRPDFIEPEVAARAEEPQDETRDRQCGDTQDESTV